MAKNQLKQNVISLTPETLFKKFDKCITKEEFMFVNLIVFQDMKPEDALIMAFPKSAKWKSVSRQVKAAQLISKYQHPYVYEYYKELLEMRQQEYREQLEWTKERAQKELIGIVDAVNEESKPYLTEDGDIQKPKVTKTQMDAKIQAITELNKITGITEGDKNIINVPVIFSGEDKLEEEARNGGDNETNNGSSSV